MTNLTEICASIKNYFLRDIISGTFKISGGTIAPLDFLLPNQYFRIVGSVLNDGVYQNNDESLSKLQDETFEGAIWSMAVPPDFIALCEEIIRFIKKVNEMASAEGSYISESFNGYSRTIGMDLTAGMKQWQADINSRLNTYRRISIW